MPDQHAIPMEVHDIIDGAADQNPERERGADALRAQQTLVPRLRVGFGTGAPTDIMTPWSIPSHVSRIPSLGLVLPAMLFVSGCQTGGSSGGGGMTNMFQASGQGKNWTILCMEVREDESVPDRRSIVEQMAAALGDVTGIDPKLIQVSHDETASRIHYGQFRPKERNGTTTFDTSVRELAAGIRTLAVGEVHPFLEARLVPMPTADVGPPEWHVKHCAGPYTLEVAEFYNERRFNERKQAAVETCRLLREKGYEAYYWHGPQRSSVCVGAWQPKKDFLITPRGIYPGPKLKELIASDPDLLKYKIINGGYSTEMINGNKVRARTMPIEVPGRGPESESSSPPRTGYRPMRR